MDRRIKKTRASVFSAFERLLMKRDYSRISVQDIIDEADIGRSTFYAHFETKDALLEAMCSDLFDHIFSSGLTAEYSHDFSNSKVKSSAMLTHILYHLKDDEARLKRIFTCESADLFWRYFKIPLSGMVMAYILPLSMEKAPQVPEEYLINHISSSYIETVKWWFKGGLKETPEEIEGYFETVIL